MKRMKNKKGQKLISIWWLIMLAIVGVGITAGVLIYSSANVDVREVEAEILNEKISDCIFENGFLIEEFLEEGFDFFEKCKLNEDVFGEGSAFYFSVKVYNELGELIKEAREGDASFERDCEIQKVVRAKNYPKCVKKDEGISYYQGSEIEEGRIEILAASNQIGGKISSMIGQGGEFGGGGATR